MHANYSLLSWSSNSTELSNDTSLCTDRVLTLKTDNRWRSKNDSLICTKVIFHFHKSYTTHTYKLSAVDLRAMILATYRPEKVTQVAYHRSVIKRVVILENKQQVELCSYHTEDTKVFTRNKKVLIPKRHSRNELSRKFERSNFYLNK